jgi:hypothetical protein
LSAVLLEKPRTNVAHRNAARFMWKRTAEDTKSSSKDLRNVWLLGKALWKRYEPHSVWDTALVSDDY